MTRAVSKTAEYVALYRALETIAPGREPLFRDPLASGFLSAGLAFAVKAARVGRMHSLLSRYADRRAPGARTSAIARTAYIDDVVRAAVTRGVEQLVLLGAGYDCRAHRLPELRGTEIFEVDREPTQALKRTRLEGAKASGRVHYVAVDFLRDAVDERLAAAGWSRTKTTLFVWEGVTNYLTEPAVRDVLGWIGKSAPGSTVVFTYIHGGLVDGSIEFAGGSRMAANVRALGEPWTFGIYPIALPRFLSDAGLTLREDLGSVDYRQRYLGAAASADRGYAFYRIAVADVPQRE